MDARRGSEAALMSSSNAQAGSYVLRELIRDVPLSPDGDGTGDVYITCVDAWNGNLYIGTSAAEILHFVSLPPDPSDSHGQPTYILASRLQPPFTAQQPPSGSGIQQILLLPGVSKACVLCNGTLTFYTLPELSPAFGGKYKQASCTWVGGLDRNTDADEQDGHGGVVIVICLKQRLRLIRIGDEARKIRDIDLGGVLALQRRGDLACVADGSSYSLIDVVNQRKVDLFPISSNSGGATEEDRPSIPESRPPLITRQSSRSFSARSPVRGTARGHERNISLGAQPSNADRLRPESSSPWPARGSSRQSTSPAQPSSREESPTKPTDGSGKPREEDKQEQPAKPSPKPSKALLPQVVSPMPNEFLLTTGTTVDEPGVGMFVNLHGDVVRGTIEFTSYPESPVVDGQVGDPASTSDGSGTDEEGFVMAIVQRQVEGRACKSVELQRWDAEPGEAQKTKEWIDVAFDKEVSASGVAIGLRAATTASKIALPEVSAALRLRRLRLDDSEVNTDEAELKRNEEEDRFVARFSETQARVLCWSSNSISWMVRNPMVARLETQLGAPPQSQTAEEDLPQALLRDRRQVERVINGIRGQEARSELDFLSLTYIRQKASLLLFVDMLEQTANKVMAYEHDKRSTEEALIQGDLDPRVLLALVPGLSEEVVEGPQGIWISQGLVDVLTAARTSVDIDAIVRDPNGAYGDNLLGVIKRYLFVWRRKKGFGSVADEKYVFQTVDAALLHVLLLLDKQSPRGPAIAGSIRAELNDVVDRGVDCFERAIALFEQYKRLYMLSRLYQSRKMVARVLATWKRIMEGERDEGGELLDGERDLRRYLTKIKDAGLVREYGAWLANRNPKLGVQVFADETSRVKFQPAEAVAILKEKAPQAVKDYLEHLVFGKNHVQYVNDLISFYLDTVLTELENSDEAKATLVQSYETYRALKPPKPTYRQFITDNSIDAEWWHNRLRLLQLIGGSHGAASKYDVHSLGERLAPYSEELVPEMIILNGRQGKHEDAIRLLTLGLGDYDTAIRYCLLGGSSIFHPSSGMLPQDSLPSKEQQAELFEYLLHEFLRIEDLSERLERTAELLERFGGWFDIAQVLSLIPDSWSVELVSGFLVHALRRLVREKNETVVVKALSSAQNLQKSVDFIEKTEAVGPTLVNEAIEAG